MNAPPRATVGGFIWRDLNGNGQTDQEPGLYNVTVELLDQAGTVVELIPTGNGSVYHATDVLPGTYRIHVPVPPGYAFTAEGGTDSPTDSDVDEYGYSRWFTLAGNDGIWLNAGVVPAGTGGGGGGGGDRPPAAADDSYVTGYQAPVSGNVLANDTDPDGDALTAALAAGPAHGTLVLNADGSFTYTPAAGFTGTDTFTYTASDGHGGTSTATVTIQVGSGGPGAGGPGMGGNL